MNYFEVNRASKPLLGGFMNRDVVETQWVQVRDVIRDNFNNLSDEDIRQINGRYDQLISKLQQKYGYSREEAEDRIRSLNFDRFATSAKGSRMSAREEVKDDSLSVFKWILGLGIPLLLAFYLFNQYGTPTATTTTTTTQEQLINETPADRVISTGLRDTILANQTFASDIQNIQIATNNGVVTLSGTVANQEAHDFILSTAKNFNGVNRVIDKIVVK